MKLNHWSQRYVNIILLEKEKHVFYQKLEDRKSEISIRESMESIQTKPVRVSRITSQHSQVITNSKFNNLFIFNY